MAPPMTEKFTYRSPLEMQPSNDEGSPIDQCIKVFRSNIENKLVSVEEHNQLEIFRNEVKDK